MDPSSDQLKHTYFRILQNKLIKSVDSLPGHSQLPVLRQQPIPFTLSYHTVIAGMPSRVPAFFDADEAYEGMKG